MNTLFTTWLKNYGKDKKMLILVCICAILWSIWNCRNDLCFGQKRVHDPFIILHRTRALMNSWTNLWKNMKYEGNWYGCKIAQAGSKWGLQWSKRMASWSPTTDKWLKRWKNWRHIYCRRIAVRRFRMFLRLKKASLPDLWRVCPFVLFLVEVVYPVWLIRRLKPYLIWVVMESALYSV